MADLFNALRSGVKFDGKRFSRDMEAFKSKPKDKDRASKAAAIDFFGTGAEAKKPVKKPASKKRKAKSDEVQDEDDPVQDEEANDEDEQLSATLRKQMGITCSGSDIPDPAPDFTSLPVKSQTRKWLMHNIEQIGWTEPTAVQMQAIPVLLQKRDLVAIAPTGTGKTAAFVIPILALLHEPGNEPCRAVIVSPTRELANQTFMECNKLAARRKFRVKLMTKATAAALASETGKCDVLVTTPQRLMVTVQSRAMDLSKVEILLFDEADRLFEENFLKSVDEILAACSNPKILRALFSATIPPVVEQLARSILRSPIFVTVGARNAASTNVHQELVYCGNEDGKLIAVRQLGQKGFRPPVLVFVQSIQRAKELFRELIYDGLSVDVIHSDRPLSQRDAVVRNFRAGKIWILITTELLGRGMDFKGVKMVINYDFPPSVFSYIHRVGRTGRAGREGSAITLFTKEDAPLLRSIANVMRQSGCDVPDWMLKLKKMSRSDRKQLERAQGPKRKAISTIPAFEKNRRHNKQEVKSHTSAH